MEYWSPTANFVINWVRLTEVEFQELYVYSLVILFPKACVDAF